MAAAVSYDPEADVLYIELVAGAEGPDTEGQEVHPGVMLMFDAEGRIIGIEITSASKILPPGAVDNLPMAAE
jgi:uncharacterized protein YuzE